MTTTTLIETTEQAREAFKRFRDSDGFLAFDTETTGLYVRTPYGDRPRTLQMSWRPWTEAIVFDLAMFDTTVIAAFFDHASALVGHNVRFDVHALSTYGVGIYESMDPLKVHDTLWVARLHDERDRAGLKPLAAQYLNDDAADEQAKLKRLMTKEGWDWGTVPVRHLVEYGGLDAILTGRLFDLLFPRISYALDAYQREQKLSKVLYGMERAGITVDLDLYERTKKDIHEAVVEEGAKLQALAPDMNPNAPHQLKVALRERGIEVENTQAATLKRHADDELIAALLRYRAAKKVESTYLDAWADLITPEGRIHPNFNQLGAATGRMSSSDPNFQNIKRGHVLRDIFIASPGHKLVVADWNQMELRLYAHFAEDENMRAAFLSGDDIYQQAADLLGVSRQVGKMVMLASIYGAGPKALRTQCIAQSYQFGMEDLVPELESYDWQDLYDRFHKRYRIKRLAERTEVAARRRGVFGDPYIRTLGGRRQRPKRVVLPAVNGHRQTIEVYKDLANSLVQGSSADLMKQALIEVDEAFPGMLRLTVHDEMVLEVPDERVPEVCETVERLMTRNEFIPPLTVEATAADRYGDAK